jgi:serine/threonine protein kinase
VEGGRVANTLAAMQFDQIGKYKIVRKLGKGAMGEVFLAHDPVLDREVAIKVITAKQSDDETARKRFVREAKAAAALNHPNIITVHDYGEHEGMPFIVMEVLDGEDLKDLIADKEKLASLDFGPRVAVMEQICDGLGYAHSKGVVHQDLKPGNVRILKSGGVKVMDFGLALRQEDAASGQVMGTPYYMAPEQIRGDRSTSRSDIFSLGVIFYEFLSGRRPFTGPDVQGILKAVVQKDPVPLSKIVSNLPPALGAFVDRALSKLPTDRYMTAEQMLEALRSAYYEGVLPEAVVVTDTSPARELGPSLTSLDDTPQSMKSSLYEIDQYLADIIPPLMVREAVEEFRRAQVEGSAAELWAWAYRIMEGREGEYDLVALLYHALQKLNRLAVLNLMKREPLLDFLKKVGETLAQACEPRDRERLRRALERLGDETLQDLASRPRLEDADDDLGPPTPYSRRLSILEQRLRREGLAKAPANDPVRRRVIAQALAAAAAGARNDDHLSRHLRRLGKAGVSVGEGAVFKNLGNGLGDWALPLDLARDTASVAPPMEVAAMERIVSIADDPVEMARRYRQLVDAAVEQFNTGHLGRAVQMFDLARRMALEEKIEPGYVAPIRSTGHDALDPLQLRRFMERPERRGQLQQVMAFFEGGLGVSTLLDQIETEEDRTQRRLLLDLLVVHGKAARAEALDRLRASLESEVSDFGRRNWIYLLRQMPRTPDEDVEPEVEAVSRFAGPGMPIFLVKEALTHLGQVQHASAARALVALLERWESYLLQPDLDRQNREDGMAALERLAVALARQNDPHCWDVLIDHALSGRAEFGAAEKRLEELGSQDLSTAPDVVDRLLGEIEDCLPRGVLGRLVGRKGVDLPFLIAAVAGTRTPEVQEALEEVARRLRTQDAGRAATRVLRAPPVPGPLAGLTGKLDAYGLPTILNRIAEEKATGTLTLRPQQGVQNATLSFVEGRPVLARWGTRQGLDALYQVFERPFPGSYGFDSSTPSIPPGSPALPELAAVMREGLRRSRELERTSALLPDDVPLEATGEAPTTVPDEPDYELVKYLWDKACKKATIAEMETGLTVDAYRVRHPLAYWVEEGALQLTPPEVPEPDSGQASASPGT